MKKKTINQKRKLKGSAFLTALLVIFTCSAFVIFYQQIFFSNLENNKLLLDYFS